MRDELVGGVKLVLARGLNRVGTAERCARYKDCQGRSTTTVEAPPLICCSQAGEHS